MKDSARLKVLVALVVVLCALTVAYGMGGGEGVRDYLDYLKRKAYYEEAINREGLSQHGAMYWRKLED